MRTGMMYSKSPESFTTKQIFRKYVVKHCVHTRHVKPPFKGFPPSTSSPSFVNFSIVVGRQWTQQLGHQLRFPDIRMGIIVHWMTKSISTAGVMKKICSNH